MKRFYYIIILVAIGFLGCLVAIGVLRSLDAESMKQTSDVKKVIVECDVGPDDAWALKLLLESEEEANLKVIGIVASFGNANRDYTLRNLYMILEILGRLDIPIYKGAFESIISHEPLEAELFGVDGFGDVGNYGIEAQTHLVQSENAVSYYHRTIMNNPTKITIISIGSLTSLALLFKTYSDVSDKIKEIYMMGGNDPDVVEIPSRAEFNFRVDVEAVDTVLRSAKCPITLLTWESSKAPYFVFPMESYINFPIYPNNSEFVLFMRRIEEPTYKSYNIENWSTCDGLLVMSMLYPEFIKQAKLSTVNVQLESQERPAGSLINANESEGKTINIIVEVDNEMFNNKILQSISN